MSDSFVVEVLNTLSYLGEEGFAVLEFRAI
jgi:hypothetical protein